MARATGRAGKFVGRQARRASRAEGAGESGLARLIEMHTFNTAGDAAVAISLAGTLFFQVPTGEARGQVALFLGLTMLPFAIVAPLIGPFLDRFSHGRRWAIGSTMAIRAFLCWVLGTAVVTDSTWLFPAALGVLIASKAYGVARAAAVPRLLPERLTLVKANARVSLSGVVGAPCPRRSPGWRRSPAPSGRCATRSCSSSSPRSVRSGSRPRSTPAAARARWCCAATPRTARGASGCGSPEQWRSRSAPTAVRAG